MNVSLLQLLFGFLRLGFMTTFLSEPLVSGYTTGAAVHVFTSQLRHIVGVPSSAVRVDPGVFALPRVCDFPTVFNLCVIVVCVYMYILCVCAACCLYIYCIMCVHALCVCLRAYIVCMCVHVYHVCLFVRACVRTCMCGFVCIH